MYKIRAVYLMLLGGAAAAVGGCTQPQPIPPQVGCDFTPMLNAPRAAGPAITAPTPGTMSEIPLNSISMTDMAITNKILVQTTTAKRTPTGTVQVYARMVNCTDFPLQVEGRTRFLDQAQMPTEAPSAWRRVFLPARSLGDYYEPSVDARQVASYVVELREGR
jgi:hypothetical protein